MFFLKYEAIILGVFNYKIIFLTNLGKKYIYRFINVFNIKIGPQKEFFFHFMFLRTFAVSLKTAQKCIDK